MHVFSRHRPSVKLTTRLSQKQANKPGHRVILRFSRDLATQILATLHRRFGVFHPPEHPDKQRYFHISA